MATKRSKSSPPAAAKEAARLAVEAAKRALAEAEAEAAKYSIREGDLVAIDWNHPDMPAWCREYLEWPASAEFAGLQVAYNKSFALVVRAYNDTVDLSMVAEDGEVLDYMGEVPTSVLTLRNKGVMCNSVLAVTGAGHLYGLGCADDDYVPLAVSVKIAKAVLERAQKYA